VGQSHPRQSILDIPFFLLAGGPANPCSKNIKAAHAENAVFSAVNRQFGHRCDVTAAHVVGGTASHFHSRNFFACLCAKTLCPFLSIVMYCYLDKGIPGASR
jgi:hypothetical protein